MAKRPIGVFDSGVGGLTVLEALERRLPAESMVYLGDTARVPYGTKSPATVIRYSLEAARYLMRHDVKMLVVACNSASAVAIDALRDSLEVPVVGVIGPGARRAAAVSTTGRIGVIATRGTVQSGAYARQIKMMRPEAEVTSAAAPLFVPLAEEGWVDNDVARQVAEVYLAPFREARIDTLVLGCTHYPLLKGTIGAALGSAVRLVDSAESVAEEIHAGLEQAGVLNRGEPGGREEHRLCVTDAPGPFLQVAERFLGRRIERLEQVRVEGE